jgi:hypothetical protein
MLIRCHGVYRVLRWQEEMPIHLNIVVDECAPPVLIVKEITTDLTCGIRLWTGPVIMELKRYVSVV